MSLDTAQKALIHRATDASILNYLSQMGAGRTEWLPLNHPMISGVEHNQHPQGPRRLNNAAVASYLATSGTTHCANGWTFFSRALSAMAVGDAHSAWHFAYYAELRAALSLLANSGVGVFDKWNCVLTTSGLEPLEIRLSPSTYDPKPGGTHRAAWEALDALVTGNVAFQQKLTAAISVAGVNIDDFVRPAFPGVGPQWSLKAWIDKWTFDLRQCTKDKLLRNRGSYEPHENWSLSSTAIEAAAFLSEMWSLLEPSPASTFQEFDRYLFRSSLEAAAELHPSFNGHNLAAIVTAAVGRLDQATVLRLGQGFLLRNHPFESDPSVISWARHRQPLPMSPFPAISRSMMLLRLATGVTKSTLSAAGTPLPNALDFWIDSIGLNRGLWGAGGRPADLFDLWTDIEIGLTDLDAERMAGGPATFHSWLNNLPGNQTLLTSAERAALWSVAT